MTPDELLALPVAVDLATAAKAWGIGRSKAYELAKRGRFPVEVRRVGDSGYRVLRSDLLSALGVEDLATERFSHMAGAA